jgi:hypothetical protein
MEINRGGRNPKSGGRYGPTLPYFEMVDPHITILKQWDRIEDIFHQFVFIPVVSINVGVVSP